jgi:hypothetical protein
MTMTRMFMHAVVYVSAFLSFLGRVDAAGCTGPSELPPAGVSTLYCDNGRMGFAVSESAAVSQAKNLPRMRALDFARREAELKARIALARFITESSMQSEALQKETLLDSIERQEWKNFLSITSKETFRTELASGIAIVATETRDDAVYVTAASFPDLAEVANAIAGRSKH